MNMLMNDYTNKWICYWMTIVINYYVNEWL